MAPKSLAEQMAELEDLTPRDYDPEDLDRGNQDSDEEGAGAKDENAGREHYQAVGKAKLRKQDPISLGKQYAGSKVSRAALEADSDDDPFAARSGDEDEDEDDDEEDEEEDEDEDLELGSDEDDEDISESEEEEEERPSKSAKKGKKQVELDDMDTDESDDLEGSEGSFDEDEMPSDEDEDEDDESDDEDDDEESESDSDSKARKPSNDRDELRRLMATDQKTIAASISQAAKADAAKGKAVKQQRATFDALLNTRIKLQKGLTAINQLSLAATSPDADSEEAITSAESAALALWSTLEDLRVALADAHNTNAEEPKKRKRVDTDTPTATLWTRMTDLESAAITHRRTILDKWSAKVRGSTATTAANSRGKLLNPSGSGAQSITAVLDAQIATETGDHSRAAKRARQDTTTTTTEGGATTPIYDDTVFYQSLLRDLVEQRMASSDAITNGLDTLHIQLPTRGGAAIHPVTGMRKDKVKRDVDTRASKGRKMRFDVHEKLQNFMAPEDRGSWTKHAREEFFASLLGKTASGLLREESGDEESGAESEEDREEGGLRLFRS